MECCHSPGRGGTAGAGQPFPAGIPWERHWSFARVELGLSDAEFWALTLHEVDCLAVRWQDQQVRRDTPLALLAQILLNANRDPEVRRQPFEFAEIMGWLGHTVPPPPPPPQRTPEEVRGQIELLHALYSQAQASNGHRDG